MSIAFAGIEALKMAQIDTNFGSSCARASCHQKPSRHRADLIGDCFAYACADKGINVPLLDKEAISPTPTWPTISLKESIRFMSFSELLID